MPEQLLIPLAEAHDAATAGGKARGLATMLAHGLPVPPGCAVGTAAFEAAAGEAFARACALTAGLDADDLTAVAAAGAEARALLRAVELPAALLAELTAGLTGIAGGGAVAVRSSAVGEDGDTTSFAGEHDSVLGVRTPEQLRDALRACWASLFSDRAITYRAASALRPQPMGVVVQRLVQAESAGVLMTLNPANGDRSSVVVESVWGLCEPLVSGGVTPDRFVLDRVSATVRVREIAAKPTMCRFAGDGVATTAVGADRVHEPSLGDDVLAALHSSVRALEACAGGPADAEFAYDGRLWFVQVRPETYWATRRPTPPASSSVIGSILATMTRSAAT